MPFTTKFMTRSGTIITVPVPGATPPDVFIAIASAAISGFHTYIGSGAKPIMVIAQEKEIAMIGYGVMSAEAYDGLAVNFGFSFLLLLMA